MLVELTCWPFDFMPQNIPNSKFSKDKLLVIPLKLEIHQQLAAPLAKNHHRIQHDLPPWNAT
jgi:hypothetical protein